jgi:diguanylate cyclase (GGDEF)-like protein
VLLVDIDRFKDVNDSLGYAAGDDVLVNVADRLRTAAPGGALVARVGGDEFAILLEAVPGQPEAQAHADRIIAAIRPPFQVDGQQVFLAVSVGLLVVEPSSRPMNPSDVMRDADFALYSAKEAGTNRVATFDLNMRAPRLDRARLGTALRQALDHGDLFVHYQPIVDLRTETMVGVEALARWQLPNGEMVPPAEFIPVAEEAGLIGAVDARVFGQACREALRWHTAHGLLVAINVSAREVEDSRFTEMITTRLGECGMPPAGLVLELTESSLIGIQPNDAARIHLKQLRMHGIRIAIDDFGSGYSSLSYLSQLPTDIVKLDKTLTQNRGDREVDKSGWEFTRAIVQAITSLHRKVIAEGLEAPEQARALSELGCTYGQGFLYSRPVPATDIDHMLQRSALVQARPLA